ncbi:hypothetical protein [Rugamonas violacea]|uniref:hypothetical protein n=1 Tax=Rugamonas sp. CCM 8940 TaxID=2765359 RepID=UPI00366BF2EF
MSLSRVAIHCIMHSVGMRFTFGGALDKGREAALAPGAAGWCCCIFCTLAAVLPVGRGGVVLAAGNVGVAGDTGVDVATGLLVGCATRGMGLDAEMGMLLISWWVEGEHRWRSAQRARQ